MKKWIPVLNELPTIESRVIVYTISNRIVISRLTCYEDNLCWVDDDESTFDIDTVTHWIPLPETPKRIKK